MSNSTVYMVVAYVATTLLYGVYLAWLWRSERRLERASRDAAR